MLTLTPKLKLCIEKMIWENIDDIMVPIRKNDFRVLEEEIANCFTDISVDLDDYAPIEWASRNEDEMRDIGVQLTFQFYRRISQMIFERLSGIEIVDHHYGNLGEYLVTKIDRFIEECIENNLLCKKLHTSPEDGENNNYVTFSFRLDRKDLRYYEDATDMLERSIINVSKITHGYFQQLLEKIDSDRDGHLKVWIARFLAAMLYLSFSFEIIYDETNSVMPRNYNDREDK